MREKLVAAAVVAAFCAVWVFGAPRIDAWLGDRRPAPTWEIKAEDDGVWLNGESEQYAGAARARLSMRCDGIEFLGVFGPPARNPPPLQGAWGSWRAGDAGGRIEWSWGPPDSWIPRGDGMSNAAIVGQIRRGLLAAGQVSLSLPEEAGQMASLTFDPPDALAADFAQTCR